MNRVVAEGVLLKGDWWPGQRDASLVRRDMDTQRFWEGSALIQCI
jgi:hypothetical protein